MFNILHYVLIGISAILNVVLLFFASGTFNTIFEILSILLLILISYVISRFIYFDNNHVVITISFSIILLGILLIRGIFFLDENSIIQKQTITYTGSLNIADNNVKTKNDFMISSKKDAVIIRGTETLYLYIENCAKNKQDVYFTVIDNDKMYYRSSCVNPYQYINKIKFDYYPGNMCVDEFKLTLKYYIYKGNSEDFNNEENYTNKHLGTQEITVHVANDDEEFEKMIKKYNLE